MCQANLQVSCIYILFCHLTHRLYLLVTTIRNQRLLQIMIWSPGSRLLPELILSVSTPLVLELKVRLVSSLTLVSPSCFRCLTPPRAFCRGEDERPTWRAFEVPSGWTPIPGLSAVPAAPTVSDFPDLSRFPTLRLARTRRRLGYLSYLFMSTSASQLHACLLISEASPFLILTLDILNSIKY